MDSTLNPMLAQYVFSGCVYIHLLKLTFNVIFRRNKIVDDLILVIPSECIDEIQSTVNTYLFDI